jgi:protein tyrosine phosphatase
LIIPNKIDTDLVFNEIKSRFKEFKREFPSYYSHLLTSEIENEEINIVKCKQYFNSHKEAHHAIHAPKGKAYEILRLLMESKFNVIKIQRTTWETYTRLTDLIERHKKTMNLLNYAFLFGLEEQIAFYNFDTYFDLNQQAFESIEDAKKFKHEVQKRRQTLKRNIQRGLVTSRIDFFKEFYAKKLNFYEVK